MSIKRVYLGGPMAGIPEYNYPMFHRGAKVLRARGYEVFSPAENDVDKFGVDASKTQFTTEEYYAFKRKALGSDLDWICHHGEGIFLLPGWENSTGAMAEMFTARALNQFIRCLSPEDLK